MQLRAGELIAQLASTEASKRQDRTLRSCCLRCSRTARSRMGPRKPAPAAGVAGAEDVRLSIGGNIAPRQHGSQAASQLGPHVSAASERGTVRLPAVACGVEMLGDCGHRHPQTWLLGTPVTPSRVLEGQASAEAS
jgi:hypothetical protein